MCLSLRMGPLSLEPMNLATQQCVERKVLVSQCSPIADTSGNPLELGETVES